MPELERGKGDTRETSHPENEVRATYTSNDIFRYFN